MQWSAGVACGRWYEMIGRVSGWEKIILVKKRRILRMRLKLCSRG